jgi:putative oxidoreductase
MTVPAAVRDAVLLVARVLLGVVLIAHGVQKFFTYGIGGAAGSFAQMGVPLPTASAAFAAFVELVGGAALLVGAATPIAALLVVVDMLGAFLFAHVGNGVFVDNGGFELVAAIAAGALVIGAVGAGRYSVDHLVAGRRTAASATPVEAAARR